MLVCDDIDQHVYDIDNMDDRQSSIDKAEGILCSYLKGKDDEETQNHVIRSLNYNVEGFPRNERNKKGAKPLYENSEAVANKEDSLKLVSGSILSECVKPSLKAEKVKMDRFWKPKSKLTTECNTGKYLSVTEAPVFVSDLTTDKSSLKASDSLRETNAEIGLTENSINRHQDMKTLNGLGENDLNVQKDLSETDIIETSPLLYKKRSQDCVCSCHCRRNFQQFGTAKSLGYKRKNRSHSLPYNLDSSSGGVIKTNESHPTAFRTRLKSVSLSEISAVNFTEEIRLRCRDCFSVQIKENMAKFIFYCVIFLLLCFCGGVLMMHKSSQADVNSDSKDVNVPFNDSKQDKHTADEESMKILLDRPFKAVSRAEFEKHLSTSSSAAEMLSIFFGDPSLTEEQVNSILYMKTHKSLKSADETTTTPLPGDESKDRYYRELAYQHHEEFERNRLGACDEPRPEVEAIEDTYFDSVRLYLPSCTIVHRCRNTTGCCPRGSVCAPKRKNGIELIEKFFLVLEAVPGTDTYLPARDMVAAKTFVNHTACECQQIEVETNCHKECPNHFTKRRPGVDCECACLHGQRTCHRIHKGLLPLDESDLECIKEERCLIPACEEGEFNISTGFCPHFRRFRRDRGRK